MVTPTEEGLRAAQGGVLLNDASTSGRGGAERAGGGGGGARTGPGQPPAAAVGPEAVEPALLKPSLAAAGGAPGRRKRRAEELNGGGSGGAAEELGEAAAVPAEGLTLGQRLAALQLQAGGAAVRKLATFVRGAVRLFRACMWQICFCLSDLRRIAWLGLQARLRQAYGRTRFQTHVDAGVGGTARLYADRDVGRVSRASF